MKDAAINGLLSKHLDAYALSLGAKRKGNGWVLPIGEEVVEIHGGFRKGLRTYRGETGTDLMALQAMRDGVAIKEIRGTCLMFLAEQGEDIGDDIGEADAVHAPQACTHVHVPEPSKHSPGGEFTQAPRKEASTPPPAALNGSHLPDIHRLLPQDAQAEQGVLSSFLLDPVAVGRLCSEKRVTRAKFHIPAHAQVFGELMFLWEERMPIDIITLTAHLRGAKMLDQVGGPAFVTDLFTLLPTAANVGYYLEILEEKHTLREIIRVGTEFARRAYDASGDDAATLAAELAEKTHEAAERIQRAGMRELLLPRRFDPTNPPPRPVPVWMLGGSIIATPGNIMAVQAKSKAGKTAFLGAMIAATMSSDGDFFGLTSGNPTGKALLHFDTEQSPYDHYQVLTRSMRRGKIGQAPPWLRSYCVTDLPMQERIGALHAELEQAAIDHKGIFAVIIDGIADLCRSLNDDVAAFGLIDQLHRLAIKYDCVIVCVLHENPTTDQGKTRGHLGSQLERKAETNLRLEKDSQGVTVIFAERARSAHIPKDQGSKFQWDTEQAMHVSTVAEFTPQNSKGPREKGPRKNAALTNAVSKLGRFFAQGKTIRYSMLVPALCGSNVPGKIAESSLSAYWAKLKESGYIVPNKAVKSQWEASELWAKDLDERFSTPEANSSESSNS
ncbi:MAG: DnaB-like helicase N-terminal domain-containing protein [Chthoniobacteraceae bacterium]